MSDPVQSTRVILTAERAEELAELAVRKYRRQPDQDLYLSVSREAARCLVGGEHTAGFVVTRCRQCVVDYMRKNGPVTRRQLAKAGGDQDNPCLAVANAVALEAANGVTDDSVGPADSARTADDLRALRLCLGELEDRERDMLLRWMDGETLKTLAEEYEVSIQRVQQINAKSVDRLREMMKAVDLTEKV